MEVALKAVEGEDCLDRLACTLIFGNPKGPPRTADYSPEAWASWTECVLTYDTLRDEFALTGDRKRQANVRRIPVEEAWAALLYASEENPQEAQRFSWALVGEILGVGARAAQYQLLQRLGFKVKGTSEGRGVIAGPCLGCGDIKKLGDLTELHCNSCQIP